jgi:hypothetical protein
LRKTWWPELSRVGLATPEAFASLRRNSSWLAPLLPPHNRAHRRVGFTSVLLSLAGFQVMIIGRLTLRDRLNG